MKNPFFSPYRY